MNINDIQSEIISEFEGLTDWMDRYAYIIELGETLQPIPDSAKTPDNIIEGCQSRVWITAKLNEQNKITLQADSDALIVKGIVALLLRVLSEQTPQDIINADLHFIQQIGLKEHLSPTRSNGLVAMIKQIKLYAVAFANLTPDNNQ